MWNAKWPERNAKGISCQADAWEKCRAVKMFLAGIVLGSEQGCSMHDQGYRHRIGAILKEGFHEAAISPPQEEQPNCVSAAGFLAFGLALQKANAKTKV